MILKWKDIGVKFGKFIIFLFYFFYVDDFIFFFKVLLELCGFFYCIIKDYYVMVVYRL